MSQILDGFMPPSLEPIAADAEAIRFDARSKTWDAVGYDACRHILRDEETFARTDQFSSSARAVRGDTRSLAVLSGRDHLKLHTYLTGRVSVRASKEYRTRLIAPIVGDLLSALPTDRPVDLAGDYADQIPIRVGLAMIGVDISDQNHVARIAELKRRFTRWSDDDRDDPEMTRLAAEASVELKELLMPMIRERRTDSRDDLASEFWRTGPTVFPDWTEVDTYAACYAFLGGGETAYAMRNALYVLLTDQDVNVAVQAEPARVVPVLTTEVLRLLGPIQWLNRVATADHQIGDFNIKAGEAVRVAIAAANRDDRVYPSPTSIKLDSERRPHHLAFGHGPRYCIGVALATAEIEEALLALVSRFPDVRLVGARPPRVGGNRIRSLAPIVASLS
jgi:cytochrome P450